MKETDDKFDVLFDNFINDLFIGPSINEGIENEDELTLKYPIRIGDRFDFNKIGYYSSVFILAHCNREELTLIGLNDGNRWSDPPIPYTTSLSKNGLIYIHQFKKLLGGRGENFLEVYNTRIPRGNEDDESE